MSMLTLRAARVVAVLQIALLLVMLPAPAFAQGTCSIYKSYQTGDSFAASDVNSIQTTLGQTNMIPTCVDDASTNQTALETTADPNSSGSVSLPTTLAGELHRLRYVLQHRTGASAWWKHYEDFNIGNRQLRVHLTTTTGYKELFRGEVHLSSASTRFHVFSISTTEYVPGSAHPESALILAHVNGTTRFMVGIGGDTHIGGTLTIHATGSQADPAISFGPDAATGFYSYGTNHIAVSTNNDTHTRFHSTGSVFINVASNSNMGLGLTIHQSTHDDQILAFKSTDVAHSITSEAQGLATEANDYLVFGKIDGATGGGLIYGLREDTGHVALRLLGSGGSPSTTKADTSIGTVDIFAAAASGGTFAAGANVFTIRGRTTFGSPGDYTLLIVDAEGDVHVNGSGSLATFDRWDDLALARAVDHHLGKPQQMVRGPLDANVRYSKADLVRAGIISDPAEGRPMINVNRLIDLQRGALWQLHTRVEGLDRRLYERIEAQHQRLEKQAQELERLRAALNAVLGAQAGMVDDAASVVEGER